MFGRTLRAGLIDRYNFFFHINLKLDIHITNCNSLKSILSIKNKVTKIFSLNKQYLLSYSFNHYSI